MAQNGNKIFAAMPKTTVISKKEGLKQFKENINKIYNPNTLPQFNTIAQMICVKLTTENPEYSWSLKEYGTFKEIFASIDIKEIDILGNSIQKCLESSNTEICNELKVFIQECKWYKNEINRGRKIANSNKTQIRLISTIDCFYVLINLLSHMYRNIREYANTIIETYNKEEQITDVINRFKNDQINQTVFLNDFDNQFQFLTNYPLFKDLYLNVKDNLLNEIKELIRKIYSLQQRKIVSKNHTRSWGNQEVAAKEKFARKILYQKTLKRK